MIKDKYCEGCHYLDTMLHYSCQLLKVHIETDGKTRHLKCNECLEQPQIIGSGMPGEEDK